MVLACDVGSTNLKIQKFKKSQGKIMPDGETVIISHNQEWLDSCEPITSLKRWFDDVTTVIVEFMKTNGVSSLGISTFREGIVGVDSTGDIVFAGTNLQSKPIGDIFAVHTMTTFAGWIMYLLNGQHATTEGQRDAGEHYLKRCFPVGLPNINWARDVKPGVYSNGMSHTNIYLGGTDEQLGYMGTGIFAKYSADIVMATGTFWSISFLSNGEKSNNMRHTREDGPFLAVDSLVMYRWGPMIRSISDFEDNNTLQHKVSERYFGDAAKLWFENGASPGVVRDAVLRDLRRAIIRLPNSVKPKNVVVYGGGVNIKFARDVIRNACKGMNVLFMDGDATLLGCAKLGYTNVAGWC